MPEATIRRRYRVGLRNFFGLYQPLATTWRVCDNPETAPARLVAAGQGGKDIQVVDRLSWDLIREAGR
ncbi:MAG: hypothetical protein GXY55_10075 [Phycisphaerae bacterium]|nr:hypothetical protein [Phycisphaerae bacterium]